MTFRATVDLVRKYVPQSLRDYLLLLKRYSEKGGTIRHNYLGENLELCIADSFTNGWYGKDWSLEERQEILFLQRLALKSDSLIFDIGAHQGVVALLLKRKLAPQGRVIAVEMDEINWAACQENARLNQEHAITAVHAAIGDRTGTGRGTGRSNASLVRNNGLLRFMHSKVDMTTIDQMCSDYGVPDLIYLDVEGAETLAVKKASVALGRTCVWVVEMHGDDLCGRFGGSNKALVNVFWNHGYKLHLSSREDQPFLPIAADSNIPFDKCHLIATKSRTPEALRGS
jgi:FkbM family methyltransferase